MTAQTEMGQKILTLANNPESKLREADQLLAIATEQLPQTSPLADRFKVYQEVITDMEFLGNGNPSWMMISGDPHPYPVIAKHVNEELKQVSPREPWLGEFHDSLKDLIVRVEKAKFGGSGAERRSLDRLAFILSMSRTCALKIANGQASTYLDVQVNFENDHKSFIQQIDFKAY